MSRVSVSRTFTEGAVVAQKTREKVLAAAEKLGYQPNAIARNLKNNSTNLVALIAGYQDNLYDAYYLNRLLEVLQADGLHVLHAHFSEEADIGALLSRLLDYPLAGVVVATGSITQPSVDKCMKLNAPIILGGPSESVVGVDAVTVDNAKGIALAVDHMIERGRTRLCCVTGPGTLMTSRERSGAFRSACAARGLDPVGVVETDYTFDGGFRAAIETLANSDQAPDGLVCTNDAIAAGAISAARHRLSLAVPEDLSIIGFDDALPASWPIFELTTIRNPVNRRVREMARLLRQRIENRSADYVEVVLDPELVVRAST